MTERGALWLGTAARLLAFAALFLVFAILVATIWAMLPQPLREAEHLGSATVMALAATCAGIALIRGVDGRPVAALGIGVSRMTVPHCGIGLFIGAAALVAAVVVMMAGGRLTYGPDDGSVIQWVGVVGWQLGFFALAAYAEEVLFRGYAFQVLSRAVGPVSAAVGTSALFAFAHRNNPSVDMFALVNIFLAGLMLAAAYVRTLSLWFATAVHLGWNWTMASLFDLPVSGLTGFDTPLYDAAIAGPRWFSGAAFGPEAGIAGTIGFMVALVLVLRWKAVRPDASIAAAGPLFLKTREELHAG